MATPLIQPDPCQGVRRDGHSAVGAHVGLHLLTLGLVVTIAITTLCGGSCGAGWTGLVKEHATRGHTIAIAEFFSVKRATAHRLLERTHGRHRTEAERR
ncbi:hypothetical protein SHKM778_45750 [Streptomyces sp. KM77-8]|uniref:Uncharacterized protein n=1 Tax=Streptomyces haneummycinicus TaxID=3074435 RepID=A0AAT9HKX3_9ACTN